MTFKEAKKLQAGDKVRLKDGGWEVTVLGTRFLAHDNVQVVSVKHHNGTTSDVTHNQIRRPS